MSDPVVNRRRHPRYVLPSMYTQVEVRTLDSDADMMNGHAYDISNGGMRFELDEPVEPGTPVAVRIHLPGDTSSPVTEQQPVYVMANVVWLEEDDLDSPGPVRMACVFRDFVNEEDESRLTKRLCSGRFAVAA